MWRHAGSGYLIWETIFIYLSVASLLGPTILGINISVVKITFFWAVMVLLLLFVEEGLFIMKWTKIFKNIVPRLFTIKKYFLLFQNNFSRQIEVISVSIWLYLIGWSQTLATQCIFCGKLNVKDYLLQATTN